MRGTVSEMFGKCVYPLVALLSMLGFSTTSQGAAYIKYEGIDGESLDKDHKSWSDLISFGQAIIKPGDSTGQSAQVLSLEMMIDSASVPLLDNALSGKSYGTVDVELCEGMPTTICDSTQVGDQHCYLKYKLTNVLVTSYQTNASGNDETGARGSVKVTVKYDELNQEYIPSPLVCPPQ